MSTQFDKKISLWNEYHDTPWGRLFQNVSQENLHPYLPKHPCRILDIGGGNGYTAIAYAQKGHTVTLVDISEEMLSEARRFARKADVTEQIEFHHADLIDIPNRFDRQTFDVILCHNVIGYMKDISAAIRVICQSIKPKGILSLISVNRYSESYREILQQLNPKAALEKLGASTYASQIFETSIKLYTADDIMELLQGEGCSVIGRHGIRCIIDYIPDNDIKEDPTFYAQLERLEKAMSSQYPYYSLARYFQIVAQKI